VPRLAVLSEAAAPRFLSGSWYAVTGGAVQELPGRKGVRTSVIYTHVLSRGRRGVPGPADIPTRRPEEQ